MKIDLRWQLLLATICLAFVAFLLSYQIQTTGKCTVSAPSTGGRLSEGIIGLPHLVNPLLSDPNPVDQHLVDLIFDGLTRYDENGIVGPALANSWAFSEDNRTITFNLDPRFRWHDGQPVTSADVAFSYGLLQDEAFPADLQLREFWQAVTITVIDDTQISFSLPQPFSPFLEATTRGILPAHVLANVPAGEVIDHGFNQTPIGTGPFFVVPGKDWQEDGYMLLAPYPNQWRGGTKLDALEVRFYPDGTALQAAYQAGDIHSVSQIFPDDIGYLGALPGMRMYTSPAPRYAELIFNMTDAMVPALRSMNGRQALAQALDRDALADSVLSGQAIPLEGPYLPTSWAYNPALLMVYSFQLDQAAAKMDAEGWLIPEGESFRQKDGEPMTVRLLAGDSPLQSDLAREIAGQWEKLGVGVEVATANQEEFQELLKSKEFDVALLDIAPLGDPDLYDFWSQEAIIRGQNYGGWNHRRASEALEAARGLAEPAERKQHYDAFLNFMNDELPALTLFQYVDTYGINETVHEVSIGLVNDPRDRFKSFDEWFLLFEDVSVICTESDTEAVSSLNPTT